MKTELLSPSALAFVGDSVYSLLVREKIAEINRPSGVLHKMSVGLVKAAAQAEAFKLIESLLTDSELDIYKRGRNAHVSVPKSATCADYHSATGIETLFGYLYLADNMKRARELFAVIWEHFSDTL